MRGEGDRSRPMRGSGRGRGGSLRGRGGSSYRGRGGSPRGPRGGGYMGRGGDRGGGRSSGFGGSGRRHSPTGQRYSPPPRRASPVARRQYSPPPRRDSNRGPPVSRDHIGDSRYPSNGVSRDPEVPRYGREDMGRRGGRGGGGYSGGSTSASWADRSRTPPPSSGPIRYRSRSPVARRRSSPGYAPRGRDRDMMSGGGGGGMPMSRSRDYPGPMDSYQQRDRGYSSGGRSSQQEYRSPKERDFGGAPSRDRSFGQREVRDYGGARDRGDYSASRVERRDYSSRSYGGAAPQSDYRDYPTQSVSSGYDRSRSPRSQGGTRGRY